MEHLPFIKDPAFDFNVPCYGYDYDGPPFASFPERKGWDLEQMESGKLDKPHKEAQSMLQAWLFFGMLSEVLDAPVDPNEFIRRDDEGNLLITTALLRYHLQIWAQKSMAMRNAGDTGGLLLREQRALRCLNLVSHWVNKEITDPGRLPLHDNVVISIRLTAEELCIFAQVKVWMKGFTNGGKSTQRFGHTTDTSTLRGIPPGFATDDVWKSGLLREQTMEWCPAERRRLRSALDFRTLFSVIRTKATQSVRSHASCSDESCIAYNVQTDTYSPKHTPSCNGCETMIGPDSKELVSTVQGESFPLIKVTRSSSFPGDVSLQLVSWEPGIKFTAISHVWSDGRGNPRENKLPVCQLEWIAEKLHMPVFDPVAHRGAWYFIEKPHDADSMRFLSTRRPTSCQSEEAFVAKIRGIQDSSIELWKLLIHDLASGTNTENDERPDGHEVGSPGRLPALEDRNPPNIFWMDTLCIPVQFQDKNVRKRAIARMNEVFKAADRVLVLDTQLASLTASEHLESTLVHILTSGWMRRLWTFPEGLFARQLQFALDKETFNLRQLATAVHIAFHRDSVLDRLVSIINAKVPLWVGSPPGRLQYLLSSKLLRSRSLSHPGDEALAVSLILGLPPSHIRFIQEKTEHKDRMVRLWSLLEEVPLAILFWTGPRLSEHPYRWAPASLLRFHVSFLQSPQMPYVPISPRGVTVTGLSSWRTVMGVDEELQGSTLLVVLNAGGVGLEIQKHPQAESCRAWKAAPRRPIGSYGVIALAEPQIERGVQGVLVRIDSEENGELVSTFMYNLLMRRLPNKDWETARDFFLRKTSQESLSPRVACMDPVMAFDVSNTTWMIG